MSTSPEKDGDSGTSAPAPLPARSGRWRPVVATALVALATVLAPLAVVAAWADDQVGDTDRYVATVAPLASDPAVQDAVVDRITTEIVDRLDVEARTQEVLDSLAERGLPPRAEDTLTSLSVPLANQVHDLVEEQVTRLIRSEEFVQAWANANREAHTQMVAVLTGKGGDVVDTRAGVVQVNLATVIDAVKARLVDRGFGLAAAIPEVDAQFTVVQSADLSRSQTAFRLLSAISTVLPWATLALLLGGVAVARSRRRALVAGSIVVAASMVLLGLSLNVARLIYLDAVPPAQLHPDAAAAVFDALVHFIRLSLRSVLVLFLAVALLAWVSGSGAQPTAVRRTLSRGVDVLRHSTDRAGLDTGALGATLHTFRGPIRVAVLGGALLLYVMASHPSGRFTAAVVAGALLVLVVVEVLARPPAAADR